MAAPLTGYPCFRYWRPIVGHPLEIRVGEVVARDGRHFADPLPCDAPPLLPSFPSVDVGAQETAWQGKLLWDQQTRDMVIVRFGNTRKEPPGKDVPRVVDDVGTLEFRATAEGDLLVQVDHAACVRPEHGSEDGPALEQVSLLADHFAEIVDPTGIAVGGVLDSSAL